METGFLGFLIQAAVISLSGVMAPGPMTTATIGQGAKSPTAGPWIAVGHGIVEFPLMLAILLGVGRLLHSPLAKATISAFGGIVLLLLSVDMLRGVSKSDAGSHHGSRSPILVGVLLSAGNPYFLIWWATVGAALMLQAAGFGWTGFLVFALVHWSCDLIWSTVLSVLSYRGGSFFGRWFQKAAFGVCGLALLVLGIRCIVDAGRWVAS
jgi:threonine/homoserine/homoserine lactone efflux protein